MSDDDLKALFETLRQENASAHAETRRCFDTTAESLRGEIRTVAEGVAILEEKLDRHVERLDEKIDRGFAETQAMIWRSHLPASSP